MAKPGVKAGTPQAKHGGQATRDKYGPEHYRALGKLAGAAIRERRGSEFFAQIGRKGGQATRDRHGVEHFSRIGAAGGSAPHASRERPEDTRTPPRPSNG